MFTPVTREEGEGGSPSGAPNFSTAAGREPRRTARAGGRREAGPGGHGWLSSAGRARDAERPATASGAAGGVPHPRRRAEPAPELAGPHPGPTRAGAPGQGAWPGRVLRTRQHSPGSSRAAAMGMARRPGEELAPRGRTGSSDAELARAEGELLPAVSAQRRHGRPPGVSALPRDPHPATLRPLPPPPPPPPPPRRPPPTPHTLPSCSGEPLLSIRHFRAQVARSGPGAGGCRGGGGHSRGIGVTEFLLLRRRRRVKRRSPFWVRANCLFLYSLESPKCGLRTSSSPPDPLSPRSQRPSRVPLIHHFTRAPGSGISLALE